MARIVSRSKIDRTAWAETPLRSADFHRGPVMLRLMDQPQDIPTLPARYYRQKAAEARRAAEGVTTRAIKKRLDGSARDFDRLADAADAAAQTPDALAGVTRRR